MNTIQITKTKFIYVYQSVIVFGYMALRPLKPDRDELNSPKCNKTIGTHIQKKTTTIIKRGREKGREFRVKSIGTIKV